MKIPTRLVPPAIALFGSLCLSACGAGNNAAFFKATGTTTTIAGTTVTAGQAAGNGAQRTGQVQAPYAAAVTPRFFSVDTAGFSSGSLAAITIENGSGALTTVGARTLTGSDTNIVNINGNANWTIGRWAAGSIVTAAAPASPAPIAPGDSLHYFAGNSLTALPDSGSYSCTNFVATDPTIIKAPTGGGITTQNSVGRSSGTASLVFGTGGGTLTTTLIVSADGSNTSQSQLGRIISPTNAAPTGAYSDGADGSLMSLFENGNGSVQAVQTYRITLPNGAAYVGIATWSCAK